MPKCEYVQWVGASIMLPNTVLLNVNMCKSKHNKDIYNINYL